MNAPELVTMWDKPVRTAIRAGDYKDLNPNLILAIIWQESGGRPYAWNPEPKYRWFWNVKLDTPFRKLTEVEVNNEGAPFDFPTLAGDRDQEWWAQQASWGLMQVMGAAAREQHFREPYLTELVDPYLNIEYGLKHLWRYAYQFGGKPTLVALGRWNGGGNGNPVYADEVIKKLAIIEKE